MKGRSILFMFISTLVIAAFLLSYLSYNEVQHCDNLVFALASPIAIIVSYIPPMFYKCVDRDNMMRSYVALVHLFFVLFATVLSSLFYAETFHLADLCSVNETATTFQLIAIICFNGATILGHQIGTKSKYEPLTDTRDDL